MTPPVKKFNFLKYPYGDCTQWFAENPTLYAHLDLNGHNGIDIVRPWGEHLFAVESGVICDLKDDPNGYGMHVRILAEYKKGKYHEWTYGHLSYIHVKIGQRVEEGQYIGNIGNTGFVVSNATANGFWKANPYAGTHLHFGLRNAIKSSTGWKYSFASSPKVDILNYGNGYKGAIDPLPYFATPYALRIAKLADKTGSELYWKGSKVLQIVKA